LKNRPEAKGARYEDSGTREKQGKDEKDIENKGAVLRGKG